MLRTEDAAIHYEAVGVIGNLAHSSPNIIKKEVLIAGALQPVIGLLSFCCSESPREAALLLGQFAATDSDCKDIQFAMAVEVPFIRWIFEKHPLQLCPSGGCFYVEPTNGPRIIAGVSVDRGTNHLVYKAFGNFVRDYEDILPLGNVLR